MDVVLAAWCPEISEACNCMQILASSSKERARGMNRNKEKHTPCVQFGDPVGDTTKSKVMSGQYDITN
jgi:hypothetical protein